MNLSFTALVAVLLSWPPACGAEPTVADETVAYEQVAPIFKKYCVGCHNLDDHEGELSLESFADIQKGGEHGRAVLPGQSVSSRLIRVLRGQSKPAMPPKDEPQPSRADVALLAAWVDAGARGPAGAEPDRSRLIVPKIKPTKKFRPAITAVEYAPDGKTIAVARFGEVALLQSVERPPLKKFVGFPGKVNAVSFARDGAWLVVATGKAGLIGEARIFEAATGKLVRTVTSHRDTLYDAIVDPAGKILATASYDRRIILWDVETGRQIRTLSGHNGAIYDLAFSPDGKVLASASGDETIKLWRVETGERLDTLGQPLAEQYTVAFSPDGRYIAAGGADNRIRLWRFVSKEKPQINPLVHARFAHEGAILRIAFVRESGWISSVADDGTLKVWTGELLMVKNYQRQPSVAHAMAVFPGGDSMMIGRMDGSLASYAIPDAVDRFTANRRRGRGVATQRPTATAAETEPNDAAADAQPIVIPATVTAAINPAGANEDVDLFRFEIRERDDWDWMIEINAARSKSPLDSKVEVLDTQGKPVPRVTLQAVRDSYFTFRGKDSKTSGDFRVHNWEEMELNQYLYANGEVVKLFRDPLGPDSGFSVYPNSGNRFGFFGTTPISHALHEICYIVKPLQIGEPLVSNGLPAFRINYENDDDPLRKWGVDSRLIFRAPAAGTYFARVTDARGFGSPNHKYTLTIRPRRPDFKVTLHGGSPKIPAGSGKKFHVAAERIDGYDGEIRVDITGVPPGFHVTTPLVIEAGHLTAHGSIHALPDASQPTKEQAGAIKVTASANAKFYDGEFLTTSAIVTADDTDQHEGNVVRQVNNLGEIKLEPRPPLLATLSPPDAKWSLAAAADEGRQVKLVELSIAPGQTITATLRIERHGHKGLASFGNAEAGWNLPHGIFVDNIGLNGVLIPDGVTERTVFITAAKWVRPQTRTFFLESKQSGNQCTWPVVLNVVRSEDVD